MAEAPWKGGLTRHSSRGLNDLGLDVEIEKSCELHTVFSLKTARDLPVL